MKKYILLLFSCVLFSCSQSITNPIDSDPIVLRQVIFSIECTTAWDGLISHNGIDESVSGTSNKEYIFTKTSTFHYISIQKQTATANTLTVKIISKLTRQSGAITSIVEKSASTSSSYGIASTSLTFS